MSYTEDSLTDGEEIVEIFKLHWTVTLMPLAVLILSVGLSSITYGSVMFSHVPWGSVLERAIVATVIGFFLSLFGGIIPAYRAAKMEPVDAMALEV